MADTVAQRAPAKLNLALSVGAPDQQGMHPICTWMVTLDLCDELLVTRLEPDRASRYAILWHHEARRRRAIDWPIARDLAVRAHLSMERHTGRRLPVQMKLEKRIPVGGGLGGGSSDAAAMLRAVNQLFDLGLSDADLRAIAAGLGSDVPFFVSGGSGIVEGTGHRVESLPCMPRLHAVLAFPESPCPTGQVYGAFDELGPGVLNRGAVLALACANGPLRDEGLFNDLAGAAVPAVAQRGGQLDALAGMSGRPAHVAGSGSSLFVLCDDGPHAQDVARAVENRLGLPAVAVRAAPTPPPPAILPASTTAP
jgi:4-diphosphocytidyl-2-C-methyl-D-erythritol kinase